MENPTLAKRGTLESQRQVVQKRQLPTCLLRNTERPPPNTWGPDLFFRIGDTSRPVFWMAIFGLFKGVPAKEPSAHGTGEEVPPFPNLFGPKRP